MAIIKCVECNTDVSDTAIKCPNCGYQLNESTRSLFGKIVKWTFIVFNLFMFISVISGGEVISDTTNDAETVGAAIGISMLLFLWLVGDIILGIPLLLTRPKQ